MRLREYNFHQIKIQQYNTTNDDTLNRKINCIIMAGTV